MTASRRVYTAEPVHAASEAVARNRYTLTVPERQVLTDVIEGARNATTTPIPLPDAMRQCLFPDATTPGQQQLEAAVLRGLTSGRPLRLPPDNRPVVRVTPLPERLSLGLHPHLLTRLLTELMPRLVDGTVHGLPGLRLRLVRRTLVARLYGAGDPVPEVTFQAVGRAGWVACLAYAHTVHDRDTFLRGHPHVAEEEARTGAASPAAQGDRALSILARRVGALTAAQHLPTITARYNTVVVTLHPTARALDPRVLTHPVFGLPGYAPAAVTETSVLLLPSDSPGAVPILLRRAPG
ncbi:hypothetical protein BC739_003149 [Kutzneria viridogrisea]|uniref:Uncharacterized protein n=1 Tax=Kutzneria viridogrisea TaxID=47990 RepID=A0ABR6BGQ3_9PSEU|nr:hypothetical protein [Kutzneria viridogrisea]